jgi:hypothetical protein
VLWIRQSGRESLAAKKIMTEGGPIQKDFATAGSPSSRVVSRAAAAIPRGRRNPGLGPFAVNLRLLGGSERQPSANHSERAGQYRAQNAVRNPRGEVAGNHDAGNRADEQRDEHVQVD